MRNIMIVVSAVLLGALMGCGAANDDEAADDEAQGKEGVFDPMAGTVDRAREVEDLVQQQKKDLDDALEQAQKKKDTADNDE